MKLIVTEPDYGLRRTLISDHLKQHHSQKPVQHQLFKDHSFSYSDWDYYGRQPFRSVQVTGPNAEYINSLLSNRKLDSDLFIEELGYYVYAEVIPNDTVRVFHVVDVVNGRLVCQEKTMFSVHAALPQTRELLLHSRNQPYEWGRYQLDTAKMDIVYRGGYEGYLCSDRNTLFTVEDWAFISLVDIHRGIELDRKTKRHLAKFATKVIILRVIHFDPDRRRLFLVLMKRQDLSYSSLIRETMVQIDIG